MISRYVRLYIEQNIRHKSESLYKDIIFQQQHLLRPKEFQEKYVTLKDHHPKNV
jgi:hypothetical protein